MFVIGKYNQNTIAFLLVLLYTRSLAAAGLCFA